MEVQSPSSHPSTSEAQFVSPMLMVYIKGPKVDWKVNVGLYHRFLKWKLKCENILDCELAILSESKKCKKVIGWSGNFRMDQYVSRCLPTEDLCLDTIWAKYEYFASHKQITSEPDLTCLQVSDKETDHLMSGTMLYKHKCLLPNTHQKLQVSCIEIYSGSS